MAHIDKHAPGSFCWIELGTSDQNAAKAFYSSLFGWTPVDSPMGPNEFYTIFKLEDRDTAAAYTMRPDQTAKGVPPHWMIYVAVESADKTAKRVAELGGKVLAPAFDVFTFGRMAVLQDPTGATFSVWEKKEHFGIGIAGAPGTLCWADLNTSDVETAKKFYAGLFGWEIASSEHDKSGYLHIKNGEEFIGGMPPAAQRNPNAPPHWMAYFYVADCDASTTIATAEGAQVYLAPMSMENVGRMAVLGDPQGAVFALFQSARMAAS